MSASTSSARPEYSPAAGPPPAGPVSATPGGSPGITPDRSRTSWNLPASSISTRSRASSTSPRPVLEEPPQATVPRQTRCSTASPPMATSRQSARNCGPRRWAGAWCSCSENSPGQPSRPGMPHDPEIHPPAYRIALQRLSQAAELAVWRDPPCQASPMLLRLPDRSQRLARRFKAAILLGTSLVVVVSLASSSARYQAGWLATPAGAYFRESASPPVAMRSTPSGGVGGCTTSNKPAGSCDRPTPSTIRPCEAAGLFRLDPDHVCRSGISIVSLLPSTIFEPDDTGRSYRFRPVCGPSGFEPQAKGGSWLIFPCPSGPSLIGSLRLGSPVSLDLGAEGAIAPVPRISTKSGPFSPGEWLESLPGSARGY